MSEAPENYVHPKTIDRAHALRLGRLFVRKGLAHAMVPDHGRWQVIVPIESVGLAVMLIEDSRES